MVYQIAMRGVIKMGQLEIINFLKDNIGNEFTTKQLAENLGVNQRTICASILPLREYNLINYKMVTTTSSRSRLVYSFVKR